MSQLQVLRSMAPASDHARCRMLRILTRQELTVSELYAVFDPGSTHRRP